MDAAEKKPFLPPRAVKALIWCGPTLFFLLTELFLYGLVPTEPENFFSFGLIPVLGLVITRLIFLHRSRRSLGAKAALTLLWVLVLVFLFGVRAVLPREEHRQSRIKAPERFETTFSKFYYLSPTQQDTPRSLLFPLELGSPESLVCHSHNCSWVIFQSQSCTLLCRYGEEEYEAAKAAVEARYRFRTELMDTEHAVGDKQVKQIEPHVRIGDDYFRVLMPRDGEREFDGAFYKFCILIVTNDARREIGYIAFSDFDLDIAEDLAEFLNDYCGWQHIRR